MTTLQQDATRLARAIWTRETGLRTYAVSWVRARTDYAVEFETDTPWGRNQQEAVDYLTAVSGFHITETRKTRMTVTYVPEI